ncbi:MAG TPA: hypothetical protein VKU00_01795 [Chthonomonadaceae bacterium]|nr:hypothetical protein [Chthonomonadaceae bacterium]
MIPERRCEKRTLARSVPTSVLVQRLFITAMVMYALCTLGRPVSALPVYARQFGVPCSTCHTVPPRLNKMGLAFQANYYNWPGPKGHARVEGVAPLSTITTFSYSHDATANQDTANFRLLELQVTSGLGIGPARQGGYFFDVHLATTVDGDSEGDLENAFFAFPLVGRRGQLAVLVGQEKPLMFQYDAINSLTDNIAYGLSEGVGNFALEQQTPMLSLDYFDNRGKISADGNYVRFAALFQGQILLNRQGTIGPGDGYFLHAFHRWGYTTVGAMSYVHKDSNEEGLVGTYALNNHVFLTSVAALAHQPGFNSTHLSMETEYLPSRRLSLTGRAELIGGGRSEVATVAAINYYPLSNQYLRLTAESHQRRTDRGFDLTLRVQY